MKRVLVVYYSQSGQVRRAMEAFTAPLRAAKNLALSDVGLQPQVPFPFPWGSFNAFFGVLPETVLELASPNVPIAEATPTRWHFDLVILAYPVWFLMPAPPIQQFLNNEGQGICGKTDVITLCVCRGMWHHATKVVRRKLVSLAARHRDNIVVTHQGPQWGTFISVPRQLLFGSNDRPLPGLVPAGIGQNDLERLRNLGQTLRRGLESETSMVSQPFLSGCQAVVVRRDMIVPELLAWPIFRASAHFIRFTGRFGAVTRKLAIYWFAFFLLALITIALPLTIAASRLSRFLLPGWYQRQAARLSEPTGLSQFA